MTNKNYDIASESVQNTILENVNDVKNNLSAAVVGAIKKVQRGKTTGVETVTIEAVDMNKTIVISVSKGSAGTVATSGTIDTPAVNTTHTGSGYYLSGDSHTASAKDDVKNTIYYSGTGTIPAHTSTFSGGTTDLTVKEYSAYLTSSTTLECDGAVEWQVIEFY